jgi:hypothetical protein
MKNISRATRRAISESKSNASVAYKKKNRIKGDFQKSKHKVHFRDQA